MKKLMLLVMSGLCASFLTGVYAAEPKSAQPGYVNLVANDATTTISIPKKVAELSITLKNMLEDIEPGQENTPIPLPNIDGPVLKALGNIMKDFVANPNMPEAQKLQLIRNEISEQVTYTILIWAINYLDIELLKGPVANEMVQDLHKKHNGDRELIEAVILSLNLPEDLAGLLAKYWYLNYGENRNFILPNLDYGFSIEELRVHNKLPKVDRVVLVLSKLRINDLSGLRNIPGLNNLRFLVLRFNKLTNLVPDVFNGLNNLVQLDLHNNKLTNLVPGAFNGLNNLIILDLSSNELTNLVPGVFNSLNNLMTLRLANNKLTNLVPGVSNGLNNLIILDLSSNQFAEAQKEVLRKQLPATVSIEY